MTSGKDTDRAGTREAVAATTSASLRSNSQPDARVADLPPRALRLVRRAETWLKRGEPAFASQSLNEALALAPEHPEVLRMRALILHQQQRHAESITLVRQAIALRPDDQRLYNNLGSALAESDDMNAAVAAFQQACELAPTEPVSWFNLGKALDALHRTEAAEDALAHALACDADYLEAIVLRAESLRTMGRIDEAIAGFRKALSLRADSVEAWSGLIGLKTVAPEAGDLAALDRLYQRTDAPEEKRVSAGYVYGLALEASGRYTEAFEVFVPVNALQRRSLRWDAAAFSRIVDSILEAFTGELAGSPDSTLGSDVILLMGMPRSGSTLAEQILSAHAEVEGLGEIADLPAVLRDESRDRHLYFPAWVADATPDDWARLGADYLQRAGRKRSGGVRVFTDKSLSNWELVGAAKTMLPGAHFIDCRRDPVESCWSCFKHQFGETQPFACEFSELAARWRDYDRSMTFWNQRYPGLVYRHDYEALIAEPEMQIRRLLDHCGLAFDPACLRFHESSRDVRTASAAQVRSPLRSDTAISHHYGALLDPLRQALAGAS